MKLGELDFLPLTVTANEMCAAGFKDGRLVSIIRTWERLSPQDAILKTSLILPFLRAEDSTPKETKTQKLFRDSVAEVMVYSFDLTRNGRRLSAILDSSEAGTTIVILDSTVSHLGNSFSGSGASPILLKEKEEPIKVRDYVVEVTNSAATPTLQIKSSENRTDPCIRHHMIDRLVRPLPQRTPILTAIGLCGWWW